MIVTWGNTYSDSQNGLPTASSTLTMNIQMNFGNVINLSTAASAGVAAGGGDAYLQFYLTFLNYDSDTINTLPYDAFVGIIQLTPTAGTSPALDELEWKTLLDSTLNWGNDWIGDTTGALVSEDTGTNDFTLTDSSDAALQSCTYYITLNINNVQCG